MNPILNLTQHPATPEQQAVGVIDPSPELGRAIRQELTFDSPPSIATVNARAHELARLARQWRDELGIVCCGPPVEVMIAGAFYLIPPLVAMLQHLEFRPLCAFSQRDSVEERQPDGSMVKRSVFRHAGFVGFSRISIDTFL